MSTNYTGSSDKVVNSKYLYDSLKEFKAISDSDYAAKTSEHTHANKDTVLDKLGTNTDGDLTFDGSIVSDGSKSVVDHLADNDIHVDLDFKNKTTTHIADKNIHVDSDFKNKTNTHITDNSIHMNTSEKKKLNDAYQKPTGGIPKTDLSSDLQTEINEKIKGTDIYDSATGKIKESLMDYNGVDHEAIKNVGTMSHDEIEQILDNHISNTVIHQTKSLGQLVVTGDEYLAGTFTNCFYNSSTGYIELNKSIPSDPIEYVVDEATYISKVLNTGIINCPYVTFSWLGKYNSDYSNIKAYIRYGAIPTVDTTWTEWKEVPYDKTITGVAQYCQAKIVFKTSDKFKNIILKNIIIYYGVDISSELSDARTDADGTIYTTLKMRLDSMDANTKTNTTNIATNLTNITKNATDIATNTSNIATNATNIATNTSELVNARTDLAGTSHSALKSRLDNMETNIQTNTSNIAKIDITVDSALSDTSENPVQNKIITQELLEVKKSVSEGKQLLVDALTDMGMDAASSDRNYATLAGYIRQLGVEITSDRIATGNFNTILFDFSSTINGSRNFTLPLNLGFTPKYLFIRIESSFCNLSKYMADTIGEGFVAIANGTVYTFVSERSGKGATTSPKWYGTIDLHISSITSSQCVLYVQYSGYKTDNYALKANEWYAF